MKKDKVRSLMAKMAIWDAMAKLDQAAALVGYFDPIYGERMREAKQGLSDLYDHVPEWENGRDQA